MIKNDAGMGTISVKGLRKSFGGVEVLKGIDLEVAKGEVVSVIGPSGSGKSTLARCLCRLESIDGGSASICGADVQGRHKNSDIARLVGMIFQQYNLYPHMSVLQNITLAPIRILKMSPREANGLAEDLLDRVGLSDKIHARPRQLSGGQQQRVAIARALAMNPKVMIFDEPTSALDPELVGEVLEVMEKLGGHGMTMLVITHEMMFAREASDRIVFMDDGLIVEQASPSQLLFNPQQARTRQFLQRLSNGKQGKQGKQEPGLLGSGTDGV